MGKELVIGREIKTSKGFHFWIAAGKPYFYDNKSNLCTKKTDQYYTFGPRKSYEAVEAPKEEIKIAITEKEVRTILNRWYGCKDLQNESFLSNYLIGELFNGQ